MPIFTVGYGRDDFSAFAERLDRHGVTTVVDIRSTPYSRYQQDFRAGTIEQLCAERSLGYEYEGDALGGRPKSVDVVTDGRLDIGKLIVSRAFCDALDRLTARQVGETLALMCGCSKVFVCHRGKILVPELERRGIQVSHIGPDGVLRSTYDEAIWEAGGQMDLFAE